MIDGLTSGPILGKVVLYCPVDGCDWEHARTEPDLGLVTLDPGSTPRLNFDAAFDTAVTADDAACRAHLDTRPIEDFLRTIAGLRAQVAAQAGTEAVR